MVALRIIFADGHRAIYADDGHGKVATVHLRRTKTNNISDLDHYARLFAAAPELLHACAELMRQYEGLLPDLDGCDAMILARAAIAKATGTQP